jgi:DNA-binding winged helix-turn-helix (wHTH) protein/tetratricopeptide (TPR) repeat protein
VFLPGFRFEPTSGRLWRAGEVVSLRPKTAAVLAHLIAKAGGLVTKEELLSSVWPDGFVGEGALTVCVNELRQVFGDNPRSPTFIATAVRRGYRLVAEVSSAPFQPRHPERLFVGRKAALSTLEDWWDRARQGRRTVGFVEAPAGVGKTALMDEFADRVRSEGATLVGWGQCVEQFGAGEAYLPMLQALDGLCRGPGGAVVAQALRHHAPSWCSQLPGLFKDAALAAAPAGSGSRLLREFAVAIEALSRERPLLGVVEDLHDADQATIELIGYLARRREPAHLLLVGSYRPAELIARARPLRAVVQDLGAHRLCGHLSLELLSVDEVRAYLLARLAPRLASEALVSEVHQRTEGNALFVVAVTEFLVDHDLLVADGAIVGAREPLGALGVPGEVRQMLERQVEVLDEEDQQLLAAAAAAGVEFSAESVRAAMASRAWPPASPVAEVEERCEALARRHAILASAGATEWPDGTVSGGYRFTHEMYREVLYERLTPARRADVHRRIGERLATGYGSDAAEVAAELAMHFERGGDYPAAGTHLTMAATKALSRSAYAEAGSHAQRVLGMLDRLGDPAEGDRLELSARRSQVVAAAASWDWRNPETATSCRRLLALARQRGDTPGVVAALLGLHNHARTRGDLAAVVSCISELDALAEERADPTVELVHHFMHAQADSRAGRCAAAWEHAKALLEVSQSREHGLLALLVGDQFDVAAHLYAGVTLWELGYPDQAQRHAAQAVSTARSYEIPAVLARALWFAATVELHCGKAQRVRALSAELDSLSASYDLRLWGALATVLEGWAIGTLGDPAAGLEKVLRGVAGYAEVGPATGSFPHRLLAELYLATGDAQGGLVAAEEGLDQEARTGDAQGEAELWRLRGELLLARRGSGDLEEAEQSLDRALELAAERGARSWQLRAATSLARLWHGQDRSARARALLQEVYGTFTEGHDTADLRQAGDLLETLASDGRRVHPDARPRRP